MGVIGDHHVKPNNPGSEIHISSVSAHVWNLDYESSEYREGGGGCLKWDEARDGNWLGKDRQYSVFSHIWDLAVSRLYVQRY